MDGVTRFRAIALQTVTSEITNLEVLEITPPRLSGQYSIYSIINIGYHLAIGKVPAPMILDNTT